MHKVLHIHMTVRKPWEIVDLEAEGFSTRLANPTLDAVREKIAALEVE